MGEVIFEQVPEFSEGSVQILWVSEGKAFPAEGTAKTNALWC